MAKIVNGGTPQIWAIFRDNLVTITHLKNGSTVYEYSFDAYGRRRDKDDWSYTLSGNQPFLPTVVLPGTSIWTSLALLT